MSSKMHIRMVEKNLECAKRMAKRDKKYEKVVKELEAFLEAGDSSGMKEEDKLDHR